jgi:hypothetical protein
VRSFENVDIIIMFFFDGGPILQALRDRAFVSEMYGNGLLRAVSAGLQSQVFEPQSMRSARCDRKSGVPGVTGSFGFPMR